MSNTNELFITTLRHVIGQALDAAGYGLEENPMHQSRGLFRFRKPLSDQEYAFIEFQNLYHDQSGLSRFRITLLRNTQPEARAESENAQERTLAWVIWYIFKTQILPNDDHWWLYKQQNDLAYTLLDAGKLLFGYGVPWLERYEDVPQEPL